MANKTIKSTGPYRHVSYERVSKQWTGFKGFKKFLWPAEIIVAPLLRFPAALVLIWSQSNVKVELEKERNSSHFTDELFVFRWSFFCCWWADQRHCRSHHCAVNKNLNIWVQFYLFYFTQIFPWWSTFHTRIQHKRDWTEKWKYVSCKIALNRLVMINVQRKADGVDGEKSLGHNMRVSLL